MEIQDYNKTKRDVSAIDFYESWLDHIYKSRLPSSIKLLLEETIHIYQIQLIEGVVDRRGRDYKSIEPMITFLSGIEGE